MGDFFDKAKKMAGIAAEKTGDMVEMGKQKAKIMSLKSDVGDAEKKLGRIYYGQLRDAAETDPEIAALVQEITDKEAQIEQLEDDIQKIKEEGR